MSHNIHAQRNEQKIRNITCSKETQNQHISRRTKTQCRHTLTALADYTSRLPKHTDITRSQHKTCHAGIHY